MGALFFGMGFVALVFVDTIVIEFARCLSPKFRSFLEREGWDADV